MYIPVVVVGWSSVRMRVFVCYAKVSIPIAWESVITQLQQLKYGILQCC
jgi:hypothetical protein